MNITVIQPKPTPVLVNIECQLTLEDAQALRCLLGHISGGAGFGTLYRFFDKLDDAVKDLPGYKTFLGTEVKAFDLSVARGRI